MEALANYVATGGPVMIPIIATGLSVWLLIGLRVAVLWADRGPLFGDRAWSSAAQLSRFRRPIHALVGVAPLLGLLGTVMGMVEIFNHLADRALFARTGGVAGGIATALTSTQLGLVIAIPALLAARLLDQREQRLWDRLEVRGEVEAAGVAASRAVSAPAIGDGGGAR